MENMLKTVLNQLQANVYITDVDTHEIIFMNDRMKKKYNIPNPEGKICWKVLQQGQEGPCSFCKINRLLSGEEETIRWQQTNSKVHRLFDKYDSLLKVGEKKLHMQQSFDITDSGEREAILGENPERMFSVQDDKIPYRAEYLYEALLNSTDDFIYICDMKTGVFRYSPAQVELFGLPNEIMEDPLPFWKEIIHPDDWERFYRSNVEIGENKADYHSVEFRAKKYDGEYAWIRCRGQLIRDEDGEPCLFAGIMKLMGQQNRINPLTQLWNHAEFTKVLEKNVNENRIEQMAVMLLDIDDFHQINELYERSLGDQVLKTLGQEIQTVLPDNASLYRLEKDCMGIIMEHGTAKQMEKLYFAIKESITRLQEWKSQKLNIELSAGCSMYPRDGKTAEEIYKCALFTLQSVKKMGKNQILFYSENIMKSKSRVIELIRQLREDIAEDYRGFYLNFQPQVDAKTRQMIGAETLMRWKNRDGNIVSPGEFIPVMEKNGMIYHAGLWMVRESFRACKEWIKIKPNFTISVNISAVQLLEERFLTDFYKIIEEEKFPGENLIVELTESYAVRNMNVFWDKFRNLRSHGIRIAMDDFGTGYSSLEVLKTAPIDIVKIDRAFLEDILHSSFDATFISFVVAICHEVEIHVCQEGVETEDEYNFLKKMNLDCIQGYYFGKPVTESEITRQLEQGCGEVEP